MKRNLKTFVCTTIPCVAFIFGVLSLHAEVFSHTYTTKQCEDYELITDMLIGKGVALHPSGWKIDGTHETQIGVFSNLVAKAVPAFTNGVLLSTGRVIDGPSLSNTVPNMKYPDDARHTVGSVADDDINGYFEKDLNDPAGIVLYIQPKNKTINIPFFMASEEFFHQTTYLYQYESPTQNYYQKYSDRFAFFLQEIASADDPHAAFGKSIDGNMPMTDSSGNWINIAKLPDGDDVEIVKSWSKVDTFVG